MSRIRIIEFLGMPNAGLSHYVEESGNYISKTKRIRVEVFEGGKRKHPLDKLRAIAGFNIQSAEDVITKLISHEDGVLLLSRGLWDHAAFLLAARQRGEITASQYQEKIRYFDMFDEFEKAAVMVGMPVDDTLRIYHKKCLGQEVPKIYSCINNPATLRQLAIAYINTYFGMIESIDPNNVLVIDGRKASKINMPKISSFLDRVLKQK